MPRIAKKIVSLPFAFAAPTPSSGNRYVMLCLSSDICIAQQELPVCYSTSQTKKSMKPDNKNERWNDWTYKQNGALLLHISH